MWKSAKIYKIWLSLWLFGYRNWKMGDSEVYKKQQIDLFTDSNTIMILQFEHVFTSRL